MRAEETEQKEEEFYIRQRAPNNAGLIGLVAVLPPHGFHYHSIESKKEEFFENYPL